MTASFTKERIALRHYLLGRGWYNAAEAMTFAEGHHNGLRKDGVTPEFSHQVSIALLTWTLTPHLLFPEESITVALLHDVCEDYGVSVSEIDGLFGGRVAESTWAMTKVFRGVKRAAEEVKAAQEKDAIASIIKPLDRIHNQSTAVGVFSATKINEYVDETENWILPMVKVARRTFPSQDGAYQNAKTILKIQNTTLRAVAEAAA